MKKSRYSDSQILAILNQAEAGTPVSALCREHGMSSATFYKWRAEYGHRTLVVGVKVASAAHFMFRFGPSSV